MPGHGGGNEGEGPLDALHAALEGPAADDALHRAHAAALSRTMLWLWLDGAPRDGALRPLLLATDDGPVALAFDSEARLAEAAGGGAAHHAALPGRVLLAQVAGLRDAQGRPVALGLNLGCGGVAHVMSAGGVAWAAGQIAAALPEDRGAPGDGFGPPGAVPAALEAALAAALAGAAGLVGQAVLASGAAGRPVLVLAGAAPGAQAALARALAEAAALASGPDAAALDIAFVPAGSAAAARAAAVGRALPVPAPPPVPPPPAAPAPPGTRGPPRLR